MRFFRSSAIAAAMWAFCLSGIAQADGPNYHLVGWANMFMPGAGQVMLGNPWAGAAQFGYETSTFIGGYFLSNDAVFSLDGFTSATPTRRLKRTDTVGTEKNVTGDILQEFGIKAHMVNTFDAYRLAAHGPDGTLPPGIDDTSTNQMFLEPFRNDNLTNPWVIAPIAATVIYCLVDYISNVGNVAPSSRTDQASNALYTFNYGVWQPIGSGAPEEMFYRGFLQHELKAATGSPLLAVAATTTAFAFSHAPTGRPTAAVAGAYLGFLAEKYEGKLGPGITVHFWSDVILGLETILLYNKSQRVTPPTSLALQINY